MDEGQGSRSGDVTAERSELEFCVRKAKDLLLTMANAVSAMKIYPSDHDTVRSFVEALGAKFDDFFVRFGPLDLDVREHAFVCADRVVYLDESNIRSLPFFFFKDGMESISFRPGLDRRELAEFLDLVKTVSQRPGEENDIVAALWENDFPDIQYYAPDDFLENRILAERREIEALENIPELPDAAREPFEIKVDKGSLAEGRIALTPADRDRLDHGPAVPSSDGETPGPAAEAPLAAPESSAGFGPGSSVAAPAGLSEGDAREVEEMIRANRHLWPEGDFVSLTAEVVYLEEDPAACASGLDVLKEFLVEQVRAGKFPAANTVLREVQDLRAHIGPSGSPKAVLVDAALKEMSGPRTLRAVDEALTSSVEVSWPALLEFLRRTGPAALPTAAALFERQADRDVRKQILGFIGEAAGPDPGLLARLAGDARPDLSAEIIGLLAALPGGSGLLHLSGFQRFKNRALRLEAIQALGRARGPRANQVLFGFLDDPDESLRIQAALMLDPLAETARIRRLIEEAAAPAFRKKSLKEKQAILSFLGRTRSAEALEFLSATLRRRSPLPSAGRREMRLAAVAGLAGMGTPEAAAALARGARGRKVREACAAALGRIAAGPPGAKES
ncbi:MAG: HEAT repeat domain-containing protein [Acidobacteriota bacterium]